MFLGELRRRKVIQVAVAYAVVAWLLVQVVVAIETPLSLPAWADTLVIVLLGLGLPITLVLSWAFNLTPGGIVRDRGGATTPAPSSRSVEYVLIGALVVAVGWIIYRVELDPPASSASEDGGQRTPLPSSIAVLPFANLSPDPSNEYFAIGIHDTILHELASIGALNVIARTSVLRYADGATPLADIAAELRVETIMEGTVQYAEGQVRITAQLIDPATGAHLWSGNYDRPFADVFMIQSEIAARIAQALEAELLPAEQRRLARRPTESEQAYAAYLRAKAAAPAIRASLPTEFFAALDEAIAIDPSFAAAHALKGHAYSVLAASFGADPLQTRPLAERETLARTHAMRALELDPNLGQAYAALAMLDWAYWRLDDALPRWRRALELSPSDTDVLNSATAFFALTGNTAEGIRLAERVRALDPSAPPEAWNFAQLAAGNYAAVIERENAELLRSPGEAGAIHTTIALAEALRGRPEAARASLMRAEDLGRPPPSLPALIYAYGRIGEREEAQRLLRELEAAASGDVLRNVPGPMVWLLPALAIGDRAAAMRWIDMLAGTPGPRGGDMLTRGIIVHNILDDPILEEPDFVAARRRVAQPQ